MLHLESGRTGPLDWAIARQTHPHEHRCGDSFIVSMSSQGTLVSVIDGLGHGDEAHYAAEAAIRTIDRMSEQSPHTIFENLHAELKTTRGAVLSLALFEIDKHRLSWFGVGNVEGLIVRSDGKREWLPLRGGIVGSRMPTIRMMDQAVDPGDLFIMFSDGINSQCLDVVSFDACPEENAEKIHSKHHKGTDDSLILVARYRGIAIPED